MYDALTATKMLNAFVPISRFNKGEAGKIIEEVKRDAVDVNEKWKKDLEDTIKIANVKWTSEDD